MKNKIFISDAANRKKWLDEFYVELKKAKHRDGFVFENYFIDEDFNNDFSPKESVMGFKKRHPGNFKHGFFKNIYYQIKRLLNKNYL